MEPLALLLDISLLGAVFTGDEAASGVDAVFCGFDTGVGQ